MCEFATLDGNPRTGHMRIHFPCYDSRDTIVRALVFSIIIYTTSKSYGSAGMVDNSFLYSHKQVRIFSFVVQCMMPRYD
jgi:hypothetical protein